MTFDAAERSLLARLADELIPAAENFPAASQANVQGDGMDQVLAVRPDLAEPLKQILRCAQGRVPQDVVTELRAHDAAAFGALAELVASAYFLDVSVRERLRYSGQTSRAIDPRPDYLDDGLLDSVIQRGPIYRPTPTKDASNGRQSFP